MQREHSCSELQQRPTWLVSDLQDGKNDNVDVGISMKAGEMMVLTLVLELKLNLWKLNCLVYI